jgi:hypothetical protein
MISQVYQGSDFWIMSHQYIRGVSSLLNWMHLRTFAAIIGLSESGDRKFMLRIIRKFALSDIPLSPCSWVRQRYHA